MTAIPTNQALYDRIKARVKTRISRWPSAYASGILVKEYKNAMKGKGPAYRTGTGGRSLHRWFKEKWVDIKTGKTCGSVKTRGYYPVCRPSIRISSRTPKTIFEISHTQRIRAIKEKQKVRGKRMAIKY